jgi:heparinase II/III-like protein
MSERETHMVESLSTLGRLINMPFSELAGRGRQEAFKWAERVASAAHIRSVTLERSSERGPEALSRFARNCEERFFRGPSDPRLSAVLAIQAADHCRELVASADQICRARFDLLGYRALDFGHPPSWNLDPISGLRAPFIHWSRLDPLDYGTVGDSKVIWELNRHQWLVHLGQAYRLTRDEQYAEALVRYLDSWLHDNPTGMGINWTSSLEISFRLIAWCWSLALIRDSQALTPPRFADLLGAVEAHATHVERYLSHYFSPNTHLTGEALGLLYAGVVFPDFQRAGRWRSLAMNILEKESERQILSDGVYFELSTCYQRYTVDIYLHFLMLASRAGLEVPSIVTERVRSMLDVLVTLRHPDGSMPSIGDADGGWVLPLSRTAPEDFRAMFSTAAVLFKEPVYARAAQELAPDTLWLLGTSAADVFRDLQRTLPASDTCRVFAVGGFVVMRSGWDEDSHSMIFDTGPLGCPVTAGHGHADLLSIHCCVFGRPYVVDAGTCCYTPNQELRDFSRGTAAHSTIVVDGKSQAAPAGPFAWQSRSAAHLLRWVSDETLAYADAEHDGYSGLPDPVFHRRRVIFVKPRYWIVVDDLTGEGSHRIDIRFQFAPMDVRIDNAAWVRATLDSRHGLLLRTFASTPVTGDIRVGCRTPLEGWVSPNYGQLEPAPVLVYTATAPLPVRAVTLLWPSADVHVETPSVELIADRHGRTAGLIFPDFAETVMFEDGDPVVQRARATAAS